MKNDRLRELMMKSMMESLFKEMTPARNATSYKKMEYDCESNLTDEDMIMLHIDIALKNGDKEAFMKLTEQLNGVVKV